MSTTTHLKYADLETAISSKSELKRRHTSSAFLASPLSFELRPQLPTCAAALSTPPWDQPAKCKPQMTQMPTLSTASCRKRPSLMEVVDCSMDPSKLLLTTASMRCKVRVARLALDPSDMESQDQQRKCSSSPTVLQGPMNPEEPSCKA